MWDLVFIFGDVVLAASAVGLAFWNRSLRASLNQEIRERQGAHISTERLVARQGRSLSEHVESNLHR